MAKKTIYTDARYPEKINNLINNYGEINEKALEINPVIEAKADLVNGKVPQSELPSYVDDVIEGYYVKAQGKFYKDAEYTIEIQGEEGKIYVDLTTNFSYRWSGSTFVQINEVDLDDYYTKSETNALLEDKVNVVEGKGLSTNDYTDADKLKISGMAAVATSGSYNDLTNKPTIPNYSAGTGISITNGVISLDIASGDNEGF